ncbi:uncharacterized protein LOC130645932 [Hydractinia symbiolongicarpus]|uniref:uncharacterized protein LOC130645932 n=1 Tax=Hydractinia symbiolongicarpus TaxID=13093 RepID=UPI00254EEA20|nr:uncharacterized protein LOC130645932 [Hydractinia symbiolongicarpus]
MKNNNKLIMERAANYMLRSQLFAAQTCNVDLDKHALQIVDDIPVSHTLFPTITKAVKTGSRAERAWIDTVADIDYIYEIGPLKVYSVTDASQRKMFRYKNTDHSGFYQILDEYEGALYPQMLQVKLAPILGIYTKKAGETLRKIAKEKVTNAAYPNLHNDDRKFKFELKIKEDAVIGMVLHQWPKEIFKEFFNDRQHLWFKDRLEDVKGSRLYLVPKAHPNSECPSVEWRISFSLPEKILMLHLSDVHRKVYLLFKSLHKHIFDKKVKSYVLKTTFLWRLDEYTAEDLYTGEEKLFHFVKGLFEKLLQFFENKFVPNYFLPQANILSENVVSDIDQVIGNLKGLINRLEKKILEHFAFFRYFWFKKNFRKWSKKGNLPYTVEEAAGEASVAKFDLLQPQLSMLNDLEFGATIMLELYYTVLCWCIYENSYHNGSLILRDRLRALQDFLPQDMKLSDGVIKEEMIEEFAKFTHTLRDRKRFYRKAYHIPNAVVKDNIRAIFSSSCVLPPVLLVIPALPLSFYVIRLFFR